MLPKLQYAIFLTVIGALYIVHSPVKFLTDSLMEKFLPIFQLSLKISVIQASDDIMFCVVEGFQFRKKKIVYTVFTHKRHTNQYYHLLQIFYSSPSLYCILPFIFTLFYTNRRKYWFHANFRFLFFDRFTCFGMSWTRFHYFWKMSVCVHVYVCEKNFVASVARELIKRI